METDEFMIAFDFEAPPLRDLRAPVLPVEAGHKRGTGRTVIAEAPPQR